MRCKAFGSHLLIVRFTDFMVHNLYLQKGFSLAAAADKGFTMVRQQKHPTWSVHQQYKTGLTKNVVSTPTGQKTSKCNANRGDKKLRMDKRPTGQKTSNAMRIEVTARTQWSTHTQISLTRMTSLI